MDVLITPSGTVAAVKSTLITAQEDAEKRAQKNGELDTVQATFTAVQGILDAHPDDAQATVTTAVHTTEHSTKVYVDITIVPSEAIQVQRLAELHADAPAEEEGAAAAAL